jgi:hypothetical protein
MPSGFLFCVVTRQPTAYQFIVSKHPKKRGAPYINERPFEVTVTTVLTGSSPMLLSIQQCAELNAR